jgi:hypothetical protein
MKRKNDAAPVIKRKKDATPATKGKIWRCSASCILLVFTYNQIQKFVFNLEGRIMA